MSAQGRLVACTAIGAARGADAAGAAVAVAHETTAAESGGAIVLDLRASARPPRGTLLASEPARGLEAACREAGELRAAARGRLLFAVPRADAEGDRPMAALAAALDPALGADLIACLCDPSGFRPVLAAAEGRAAALVRASPSADRALLGLLVAELLAERRTVKVWTRPIGLIPARRALAGLEPGGESGRRAARLAARLAPPARWSSRRLDGPLRAERAQAMPAVLGICLLVVAVTAILLAFGTAATAKGRLQRSADLAAISAARSMRDDFTRLFVPARLPGGVPNPAHLGKDEYLGRAAAAAREAAERNGVERRLVEVDFPDGGSFAPLRVRIEAGGGIELDGKATDGEATTMATAKAEVTPPTGSLSGSAVQPTIASGGGYGGPLAYRQGKPMPCFCSTGYRRAS